MHEEAGLDLLMEFANINCAYNLMPEDLCTMILLCDALSCAAAPRSTTSSPGGGHGIDNVDLSAVTEFGCHVLNALTVNTIVAVEHGIALLAVMAKNVAQASASIKAENKASDSSWSKKTLMMRKTCLKLSINMTDDPNTADDGMLWFTCVGPRSFY
ncbi:hypothetical protein ACOSQ4_009580 [Xanthoceras sorbifolium]